MINLETGLRDHCGRMGPLDQIKAYLLKIRINNQHPQQFSKSVKILGI